MRRVLRICWGAMTIVMLMLLVATVVFWARAQFVADWWKLHILNEPQRRWTGYHLCMSRRGVYVSYSPFVFDEAGKATEYAAMIRASETAERRGDDVPRDVEFRHLTTPPQDGAFNRTWAGRLGFDFILDTQREKTLTYGFHRAKVPYWALMVLFGALGAPGLIGARRRRIRRRRKEHGECVRCGYDMRATPERCPECGASKA